MARNKTSRRRSNSIAGKLAARERGDDGGPRGRAGRHGGRTPSGGYGGAGDTQTIFGLHAVAAALENEARHLLSIAVTEAAKETLAPLIEDRCLAPEIRDAGELTRLLGNEAVHQGAILRARPLEQPTLADLAVVHGQTDAAEIPPRVVVLDQVTDPHNVGAIVRSAAVFGAAGVVMTRRNAAPIDGVAAKAASGGMEHVPIVHVGNLAQALRDLARDGYRVVGLDGEGSATIGDVPRKAPLALVLGAEGPGMRRLTREQCDFLCHLPSPGPLSSLNVSNAAAVALALLTT
ncbi:MAG: 23S rRNA (guanosine(2251)-2'-O)-methyltransferase RlmB [Pseudomonadota bacterium]